MQLGIRQRWFSGVLASSDFRRNLACSHPIGTLGHFVAFVLLLIGFHLAHTGMLVAAILLLNPTTMHCIGAVVY